MSDDLKLVLAKVKKLLRLAAGNTNVNEAAAATAKAQELIDRYKLELGELDGEVEEITAAEESLFETGRTVKWKSLLALRLAHANGCHVWTIQPSAALKRSGFKHKVKVVGKPSNVQILRYLFDTLVRELERLSASNWKQNKLYWENVRRLTAQGHALDFKLGAVRAIGERLKEERQKVRSQHSALYGALSVALVRFDNEAAEAQSWLEERLEGLVPVTNKTEASDKTAYDAGYKAGRGIVMTKGIEEGGKTRGALR